MDGPKNGKILGIAMAEKRQENGTVRYSAACPTGAERFVLWSCGVWE